MRATCPMCGGPAKAHCTTQVTATLRTAYLNCRNPACGWTGTAHLAIDRTLNPGRAPRADVSASLPTVDLGAAYAALVSIHPIGGASDAIRQ